MGRGVGYVPVVNLGSGSVVAVELTADPPASDPSDTERGAPGPARVVAWLSELVRESATHESLLPLVLPLPARCLTAGDRFVSLLESELRRAGRRPRDLTFMISPDLAGLPHKAVVAGISLLRSVGFRCGFGTAMVRPDLVLEASPFLMRVDPGIVAGAASDHRHRTIMEGLARIGRGSGVYAMASGVTTAEDVVRLRGCGIGVGTGPFFASPEWAPGERITPVPEPISGREREESGPTVTEFMVPPVGCDADTTAEEVLEAFTGDQALNSVILIDHRDRPLGLIDRTRFLLSVTGRYGHALHAKRPALRLAEPPRTVPARMSALAALRIAGQETDRVYDDLIAVNTYGQCAGVVHVSRLIQALSHG